jgi:hypothetical protein
MGNLLFDRRDMREVMSNMFVTVKEKDAVLAAMVQRAMPRPFEQP